MKKFTSLILTICMVMALLAPLSVLPVGAATTTPGDVDQSTVNQRIGELQAKLENKYFTVDGTAASENNDDKCYLPNVLSSTNKNCPLYGMRKPSSTNNIPGHYLWSGGACVLGGKTGWSCYGFANYALWYVFSQASTDVVRVNKVVEGVLDYNTMATYAQSGDVIRIRYKGMASTAEHSLMISQVTENYIAGIDCNNTGKKDSKVLVSKISYTGSWGGKPIVISRASNATIDTPTASAFSNGEAVSVDWTPVAGATQYDIYLVQEPYSWDDIKYSATAPATAKTYCFSNVKPGTYYAFVIARPNPNSVQSNWAKVVTTPNATRPSIQATTVADQLTVKWNACTNATRYDVYLLHGGHNWSDLKYQGSTTSTSYTFKNVENGTYIAFVISRPNLDVTQSNWVELTVSNQYNGLTYTLVNNSIKITGCSQTKQGSVIIPSSINGYPVTTIGGNAFMSCSSITSVTIPDSVKTIENGAFFLCSSLSKVNGGKNIETIGDSAFAHCTSLTSFELSSKMSSLSGQVFYGCTSLEEITIPKTVNSIGNKAFYNCENLVILGYKNSFAKNYAEQQGISFVALDVTELGIVGFSAMSQAAKDETARVSIQAEGDGLVYQWYYKDKGMASFKLTTSFKGNTYKVAMNAARSGRQVYCVITDEYGNSVTSDAVTLSMKTRIATQPKSVQVAKGKTAKVTVAAEGEGLTYKWYYKDKGMSKFKLTTSFKGSSYSVQMTAARSGRQVYCVVTDENGNSVTSKIVTLSMKARIATQPKSVAVAKNKTAKVTVKAEGEGLKYTWYVKKAGATKFTKSSVKTSSYSAKMTSSSTNRQLYCKITDKFGNTVTTKTVSMKLK